MMLRSGKFSHGIAFLLIILTSAPMGALYALCLVGVLCLGVLNVSRVNRPRITLRCAICVYTDHADSGAQGAACVWGCYGDAEGAPAVNIFMSPGVYIVLNILKGVWGVHAVSGLVLGATSDRV